jgi:hypothetical protein
MRYGYDEACGMDMTGRLEGGDQVTLSRMPALHQGAERNEFRVKCASKASPTHYWDRPEKALAKEATKPGAALGGGGPPPLSPSALCA